MELRGLDRARYFLPTTICAYLAGVCVVLIVTSAFLVNLQDAIAVTIAGVFGLGLTAGLGAVFWRAQRRDLQFTRLVTASDASTNFVAVRAAAMRAGWGIVREEPSQCLTAVSAATALDAGERIEVRFRGNEVLVASICDPSVGFSLVGRQHCRLHQDLVRGAVSNPAFGESGAAAGEPRS